MKPLRTQKLSPLRCTVAATKAVLLKPERALLTLRPLSTASNVFGMRLPMAASSTWGIDRLQRWIRYSRCDTSSSMYVLYRTCSGLWCLWAALIERFLPVSTVWEDISEELTVHKIVPRSTQQSSPMDSRFPGSMRHCIDHLFTPMHHQTTDNKASLSAWTTPPQIWCVPRVPTSASTTYHALHIKMLTITSGSRPSRTSIGCDDNCVDEWTSPVNNIPPTCTTRPRTWSAYLQYHPNSLTRTTAMRFRGQRLCSRDYLRIRYACRTFWKQHAW